MRTFIAVELDESFQRHFSRIQEGLRRELGARAPGVSWVRPEAVHLTLKFLGDVPDDAIGSVCSAADEACRGLAPFDIEIGTLGTFPPGGAARVAWVGLTEPAAALGELHQRLEEELAAGGFPPDNRKFSPHMTLARIRLARTGHRLREIVAATATPALGTQTVDGLTVFQSDLSGRGPRYTPLHHANFDG